MTAKLFLKAPPFWCCSFGGVSFVQLVSKIVEASPIVAFIGDDLFAVSN